MNKQQLKWLPLLLFAVLLSAVGNAQTDASGESESASEIAPNSATTLTELLQSVRREAEDTDGRNAERPRRFTENRDPRRK